MTSATLAVLNEAIDYYHSLLMDPQVAHDTAEAFTQISRRRKLFFGARQICTVLRPNFFTSQQWDHIRRESEFLLRVFAKAHTACVQDADLRAQLYLEPYEEALYSLDVGFDTPWTTSRLDSFCTLDDMNIRFVEYNAETPAGMAYEDQLVEAFLELDVFKTFQQRFSARSFPMRASLYGTLLDAYRQYGGQNMPQIGIVDWGDVPTLAEHEFCQQYFEERGCRTILADPRGLEYRGGALWAGDFRIDLLYKRVLCSELVHSLGMDCAVVRAVRDRAVCMQNAFAAKLMAKKASFALLSDEQNAHLFTETERASIDAHIPWTRIVADRHTDFHGQRIDLLPFLNDNRERMVLKPNDEYGGKGVLIGWETSPEDWANALRGALTIPYVAQEKVRVGYANFPSMQNGTLDISQRLVDVDPFVFKGRSVSGTLTRLSSVALLNVTAGGGSVVPTFIIDKS